MPDIDILERIRMGAFKDDLGCDAGVKGFFPAQRAQAPAITGVQAREAELGSRGRQVIPALF